ncbi:EthD domain-containing protein [Lentzea chajnantorensis]
MALLKAHRGFTRAEFVDYYEHHHVPLVLSVAPPPDYYARNYLPESADVEFDVLTHMRFADEPTRQRWLALVLAEGSGVAADEALFLDRSRTRSWVVEEHVS